LAVLEIDYQLKFSRLLHRKVTGLLAPKDAIDVPGRKPKLVQKTWPIGWGSVRHHVRFRLPRALRVGNLAKGLRHGMGLDLRRQGNGATHGTPRHQDRHYHGCS
jgi:hypothetical protein